MRLVLSGDVDKELIYYPRLKRLRFVSPGPSLMWYASVIMTYFLSCQRGTHANLGQRRTSFDAATSLLLRTGRSGLAFGDRTLFGRERARKKRQVVTKNISHHRGSNSVEIHLHHEPINVSNYDEHLNVSNFSSDPVEHIGFSLLNLSSSTHQSNTNESHLELSESRETNVPLGLPYNWYHSYIDIHTIYFFCTRKSRREEKKLETDEKEEDVETPNKSHLRKIPLGAHLVAIAGLGAFYVLYCSVEDTFC